MTDKTSETCYHCDHWLRWTMDEGSCQCEHLSGELRSPVVILDQGKNLVDYPVYTTPDFGCNRFEPHSELP